jgi:enoyl-CoA hydratase/carnithine racemase
MPGEEVIYKKENGVATITLNRPDKMNPLGPEIRDGIYNAMQDAAADDEVRVIIITGTGRAFCSGADVKAMA